jgi:hypothetical protein
MRRFNDIGAFTTFLHLGMARALDDRFIKSRAEAAGKAIVEEIKGAIGTYKYGWPQLAESTLKGKGGRNTPLLETGKLRDSYSYQLEPITNGYKVVVGSPEKTALWHELGTSKVPPRPVLVPAITRVAPDFVKGFGEEAVRALTRAG